MSKRNTPVLMLLFICIVLLAMPVLAAGTIIDWGKDAGGQPAPLAGNDYTAVSAGEGSSLALKSDGSIAGWGEKPGGEAATLAGDDYTAVSAGEGFSLALKSDGSMVGWGDNAYGQATPPAGNDYVAISAGGKHSLALKSDGSIVRWGYGEDTMDGNEIKTPVTHEPYRPAPQKEEPVPTPEFPLASQPAILIICMLSAMLLIQRNRGT